MGKRLGKKAGKALLNLLAPYLPIIAIVLFLAFLLLGLIGVVYSSFPSEGVLLGDKLTPEDEKLKEQYEDLADKYNQKDVFLVSSNSSKESPYYPQGGTRITDGVADHYGNDVNLKLEWGNIHSALLYKAYAFNQTRIQTELAESVANEFHPTFYYRKSTIRYCSPPDKEGKRDCSTETVYLLVEAYTIQGHFIFKYKPMQTDTYPSGASKTWEPPDGQEQILPNPWMRLDNWVVRELNMLNSPYVDLARTAIFEAGKGFTAEKENLAWLLKPYENSPAVFSSSAMIPPTFLPYFKEASEKYNIPIWFLASVAFKESSFNPHNRTGEHYGLMQVRDEYWDIYAPSLGFDPVTSKDDPKAQIMVGAYMLAELGLKNIDWDSPGWKEQTLPILVHYGGFRNPPKPYKTAEEWCLEEYAKPIWEMAEALKVDAVWPVPGRYTITTEFKKVNTKLYKDYHHGIDIDGHTGDQAVSASAGIVASAGWDGSYGQCIKITDGIHLYVYAHLSQIQVSKGQAVRPNDKIGLVGNTGKSFGSHLHFEVRDLSKGTGLDACIDPLLIVRPY